MENIDLIMNRITRSPSVSTTILHTIFPRAKEFAPAIRSANKEIESIARRYGAELIDLWPVLAMLDGEIHSIYSDDRLHLSPAGYDQWREALEPRLATSW